MAERRDAKAALIAQLDAQRAALALSAGRLRTSVDFGQRLRTSVTRHRAAWLGGAVLLGLALTRLRKRRTPHARQATSENVKAVGQTGLLLAALKIAFDLARPMLLAWGSRHLTEIVTRSRGSPRRPARS